MIELQLTLLLLLGVGFLAAKLGILVGDARKKLSDLFINFILPCNIVNSFLVEFNADILQRSAGVLVASTLAQVFSLFISKFLYRRSAPGRSAVLQYGTICSNAGFMGNPLALGMFGQEGLLYASVALIPLRFFMWSAGLSLFTKPSRKTLAKQLATHPCIVAVAVGFVLMVTGFRPPVFVLSAITATSNCTTAIAMFVIGGILAEVNLSKGLLDKELFYYSAIRLILIPGFFMLVLSLIPFPSLSRGVIVLLYAMPAGSTTAMLADKYNGDADFASRCVFVSTVLSMFTLPVWGLFL